VPFDTEGHSELTSEVAARLALVFRADPFGCACRIKLVCSAAVPAALVGDGALWHGTQWRGHGTSAHRYDCFTCCYLATSSLSWNLKLLGDRSLGLSFRESSLGVKNPDRCGRRLRDPRPVASFT